MEINLIVIRTTQPKELSLFYAQLGLSFDYHQHGKGPWHYSTTIGTVVFEIYPLLKNQEAPDISLRLGFTVEALDPLIELLRQQKVNIVNLPKESEWGYFAVVKDLDGRKIELKEKAIND
ncbi:MAG: VOC family protein [Aureispira sp.]